MELIVVIEGDTSCAEQISQEDEITSMIARNTFILTLCFASPLLSSPLLFLTQYSLLCLSLNLPFIYKPAFSLPSSLHGILIITRNNIFFFITTLFYKNSRSTHSPRYFFSLPLQGLLVFSYSLTFFLSFFLF